MRRRAYRHFGGDRASLGRHRSRADTAAVVREPMAQREGRGRRFGIGTPFAAAKRQTHEPGFCYPAPRSRCACRSRANGRAVPRRTGRTAGHPSHRSDMRFGRPVAGLAGCRHGAFFRILGQRANGTTERFCRIRLCRIAFSLPTCPTCAEPTSCAQAGQVPARRASARVEKCSAAQRACTTIRQAIRSTLVL